MLKLLKVKVRNGAPCNIVKSYYIIINKVILVILFKYIKLLQ